MAPSLVHRLVLGTVQLGLPYGRRAGTEALEEGKAHAVLDAAWGAGIRAFDTAEAYGSASERLADWLTARQIHGQVRLSTKVRADLTAATVRKALRRVRATFPEVDLLVLSHGPVPAESWDVWRETSEELRISCGQSVYESEEIRTAAGLPGVTRIQAPGNVLDARAIRARGDASVGLDLRSVFLQGVLLDEPTQAETRVPGGGTVARAVREAAATAGAPASALLLMGAAAMLDERDRLVLGAEEPAQIRSWLEGVQLQSSVVTTFEHSLRAAFPAGVEERLLDPRQWSTPEADS